MANLQRGERWGVCALPELLDLLKLTGELVGEGLLERL